MDEALPAPGERQHSRDAVTELLQESAFHVRRGDRPPSRTVRGRPAVGQLIGGLAAQARHEMLSFGDPSGCIAQNIQERQLMHTVAGSSRPRRSPVRTAAGRRVAALHALAGQVPVVRRITSSGGLANDGTRRAVE